MAETQKTTEQLVEELRKARERIAELEKSEAEHKQIEAELRKSADLFGRTFKVSAVSKVLTSLKGGFYQVNNAMCRMFGYTEKELLSLSIAELTHPDDVAASGQVVKQLIQGDCENDICALEKRYVRKDGKVIWARINVALIRDSQGVPLHMSGELEDISERKEAEEAIRASRERFRGIVETINEWVWEVDANGVYTYISPRVRDMLGYEPEEVMGKTPFDLMPPEEAERVGETFDRILATQQPFQDLENTNRHKDGTLVVIETSGAPIFDADGVFRGYRGTDRDVTERKRAEEEQVRLQQEVIEAQKQTLQALSTPIIPVMDRIIVMPLIGNIDSARARDITRSLLAGIREHRAKVLILDITGVSIVDSGVANHLNKTIQAARLKGAHTIVTGITDAVAETIVDLGIDWGTIDTLSDLQTGLVVALKSLGIRLTSVENQ